jgi:hypothetical protein
MHVRSSFVHLIAGSVVWRDDVRGTVVKGNDGGRWSFDGMVLWLGRRQNEDAVEW